MIMDYYDRTTSDLLTDVNLPEYTGFPSFKTNLYYQQLWFRTGSQGESADKEGLVMGCHR